MTDWLQIEIARKAAILLIFSGSTTIGAADVTKHDNVAL